MDQRNGHNRRVRLIIWMIFAGLWSFALLAPDPDRVVRAAFMPTNASNAVREQWDLALHYLSKTIHVVAYALFTVLSAWVGTGFAIRVALVLLVSLHGFGTEGLQNFAIGRHPSLRDVALDHIGIALGLAISWPLWFRSFVRSRSGPARDPQTPGQNDAEQEEQNAAVL